MDGFEIVAPGASGEAVFSGFALKWLSDAKMDKMVTRGRLSIHLQEALKLSKEWGEGQPKHIGWELATGLTDLKRLRVVRDDRLWRPE
jgi:hypothetical protein